MSTVKTIYTVILTAVWSMLESFFFQCGILLAKVDYNYKSSRTFLYFWFDKLIRIIMLTTHAQILQKEHALQKSNHWCFMIKKTCCFSWLWWKRSLHINNIFIFPQFYFRDGEQPYTRITSFSYKTCQLRIFIFVSFINAACSDHLPSKIVFQSAT